MLRDGEAVSQQATRSRVTVNNAETYIACALAGLGLIQIPAWDVREHIEAGQLVEVLGHMKAAPLPVHIVYPHRRYLPRRLHAFSDWLEALLADALDKPVAPPMTAAGARPRRVR
jgi:DNA-binding transcriptional LysR family regulator